MKTISALIAAASLTAVAHADILNATITADNHYALFTGTDTSMTLVGRNEVGAAGAPGTYNWSLPEQYSFTAGAFIYIAAWSDDSVAQGLLAQITGDQQTYHSGDSRWQVYPTFVNLGSGDAAPTASEMAGHVATANSGNLWQTPHVGGNNSIQPWGTIPGIATNIPWMWVSNPNQTDPLQGGSGYGEMLIFRIETGVFIPAPGAAALMGLGSLAAFRRARR